MGVVYEAIDRSNGRHLALKTLSLRDAASIFRFKEEFRGLVDIEHPNLVSLHELAVEDKQWFFTMELVRGVDLLKHLRSSSLFLSDASTEVIKEGEDLGELPNQGSEQPSIPTDMDAVRDVFGQLCQGVFALHAADTLHRDIKPSNIIVSVEGRVVLLDFGLATNYVQRECAVETVIVGTVSYMSPEQACQKEIGPASDWYSVGVVLYQALTGILPFVGRAQSVLMDKQQKKPVDPRTLLPDLPDDLCDLCMQLLQREPAKRPSGTAVLQWLGLGGGGSVLSAGSNSSQGGVFVGRGPQMEVLVKGLQTVVEGDGPQCILLSGSPGIGKTALVEHFCTVATHKYNAIVLSGRCYERESVPFKAVDTIVDSLSRYLTSMDQDTVRTLLPEFVQPLSRLFPVLRTVPAVAKAPRFKQPLDPLEIRRRALNGLRELLINLANIAPLVLRVDDFQWGDTDSAILLSSILGPPNPPNMMVCISYRKDDVETSEALQTLHERLLVSARPHLVFLPLQRMTKKEVSELALIRLGSSSSERNNLLLNRIVFESAGNPFFVEEMCRFLQTNCEAEVMGPLSLQETMMARFSALTSEQRRLLEVVAIAGTPLTEDIAMRASGLASAQATAISVLRAGRLLRSNREGTIAKLESYHDRIREAMFNDASEELLQDTYLRLACAFEYASPSDHESIADFYARAGRAEQASPHAFKAAERAVETLAFEKAALYYRIALVAPQEAFPRKKLLIALADALSNAGRGVQAAEAYLHAAEGAEAAEALDQKRLAAECLLRAGHVDQAVEIFKQVLDTVGLHFAPSSRRSLANLLWWRMRLRLRGVDFKERRVSEITPDFLLKIAVCGSCALGFGMNDPIRGAEFQTHHFLLSLRSGEPSRVGRAMALEGVYRALEGHKSRKAAERLIDKAQMLGTESNDSIVTAFATSAQALVHYQCGEWRSAKLHFDRAASMYWEKCQGHQSVACQAERMAVDTLFALGELGELSKRVPGILRAAEDRGDQHGVTDMQTGLPNVTWLIRDRAKRARYDCKLGERQWSERAFFLQHYYAVLAHIQIDLYEGEGTAALTRFDAMMPKLRRSMLLRVPIVRVESSWLEGRSVLAAAQYAEGEERRHLLTRLKKVASSLRAQSIPCALSFANVLTGGRLLLAGGATEPAIAALRLAQSGFSDSEMQLCAQVTGKLLGALVGGSEGESLQTECKRWMEQQRVVNADRFASMVVPIEVE